jgi:hypothetical protein
MDAAATAIAVVAQCRPQIGNRYLPLLVEVHD